LAEGYGLTEIAETGRLRDDANLMMESISKGVAAAERRFQRACRQSSEARTGIAEDARNDPQETKCASGRFARFAAAGAGR
jgi:hypothetical protein